MSKVQRDFVQALLDRSEEVLALWPLPECNSARNGLRAVAQALEAAIPDDMDLTTADAAAQAATGEALGDLDPAVRDACIAAAKTHRLGEEAKVRVAEAAAAEAAKQARLEAQAAEKARLEAEALIDEATPSQEDLK